MKKTGDTTMNKSVLPGSVSHQTSQVDDEEFLLDCLAVQKAYKLQLLEDKMKENIELLKSQALQFQTVVCELNEEVTELKSQLMAHHRKVQKAENTAVLLEAATQLVTNEPLLAKLKELAESIEPFLHFLPTINVTINDPDQLAADLAEAKTLVEELQTTMGAGGLEVMNSNWREYNTASARCSQLLAKCLTQREETLRLAVREKSLRLQCHQLQSKG